MKARRRGPGDWLVLVSVLVIALLTAVVLERLQESALRSQDVQILLIQIEEEVNEKQLGEYEAIAEGEVTPDVSEAISESRADIKRSLDALVELGYDDAEALARVRELLIAGEAAIDEELRLVEEDRLEEARDLDEEVVDPTFEELRDALESADTGLAEYAGRVDTVTDVGGFAVASLSVLLTAWFVRRDRNRRAGQKALEESEERFRSLVQEGADLIWILDPSGTVRYAAPSVERVLGHPSADLLGKDIFSLLVSSGDGAEQDIMSVLREPGAKATTELRLRRADSSLALFEATFSNMLENPGVGGIVVNGRDVTERRMAEEVLRDSEERYRTLYEDNPSMYFTLDPAGVILSVNRFGARQLGYEPAELVDSSVLEIFRQEDREAATGYLADCLGAVSRVTQWEIRKVRKDGSLMWVRETARAVPDPHGETVILVNCEDVTERKEAETLLLRQGAAMESAANGIAILDEDGMYVYVNDAHARIYGYDGAGELVGRKSWRDVYSENQLAQFDRHIMPTIGRQGYWRGEAVGCKKDGSPFPQELSVTLLESGGFVCIVQDITKRKESEAEIRWLNEDLEGRVRERTAQLRASEARLRALFAAMTDVILVLDSDGRYLEIAPTNPSLLYKPPEETIGRTLHQIFPKEQADGFLERVQTALRTRETADVEYSLSIQGREVWFAGAISPMQENSVLFVARDITERKGAEEAVKRSEERHRALVDTAPDAIITVAPDGLIRSYNRGAERIFGYGAEEAVGRPLQTLMPERFRGRHERGLRRYVETGESRVIGGGAVELAGLRKCGEEFPLELSLSAMNGEGEDVLFTGILRDITERKKAEEDLKSYARKLAQSNSELQSFAYVASHDLQEPLRKVRTFGDRLRSKYADALDERALDYLSRMEGATSRMQSLIDDLLTLSRITTQARPFSPVDLGEVVEEVLSDLETRVEGLGGRVEVGALPVVEADRMQMRQLFQNLISNALKFHREGEPPVVRIRSAAPDKQRDGDPYGGRFCRLVVEDDGIGIEKEHLELVFAPFERLHGRGVYEGTGIGLAICRRVVERHGGAIEATHNPGRGAAFVVTLPLEQARTETTDKKDGAHDYAAAGR